MKLGNVGSRKCKGLELTIEIFRQHRRHVGLGVPPLLLLFHLFVEAAELLDHLGGPLRKGNVAGQAGSTNARPVELSRPWPFPKTHLFQRFQLTSWPVPP